MSSNKPVAEVRVGAVKAAIWPNQSDSGVVRYNVTFSRIYKDGEGNWKSTSSFGRDDLLVVAKVADMAHTKIFEVANGRRPGRRTAVLTAAITRRGASPAFFLSPSRKPPTSKYPPCAHSRAEKRSRRFRHTYGPFFAVTLRTARRARINACFRRTYRSF